MNGSMMRAPVARWQVMAAAGGALALAALAGGAHAAGAGVTLDVAARPDGYLAGGVIYPDLDTLGALVEPASPALVRLAACGAQNAGTLLAAAERLRGYRLELQLHASEDADCRAGDSVRFVKRDDVRPARPAPALRGEAYWRDLMP
jgi:hypothetical protein